jgi:hypothetical protein
MKKLAVLQGLTFAASLCLALPALSQDSGTLKKIKDSGAPPWACANPPAASPSRSATASSPASTSSCASARWPTCRSSSAWRSSTSSTSR